MLPLDFNLNCCNYILADLNNYFTMKCNKLYLYNWNYLCIKFCATLVIIPFDILIYNSTVMMKTFS